MKNHLQEWLEKNPKRGWERKLDVLFSIHALLAHGTRTRGEIIYGLQGHAAYFMEPSCYLKDANEMIKQHDIPEAWINRNGDFLDTCWHCLESRVVRGTK